MHEDFQSSVWGLSDADGYLAERYNYTDPYGVSDSEDGSANALGDYASDVFHRKRLQGGFVEEVTELYDFRHRWFQPDTGAWLSRDPLSEVDTNLYQFVINRPLTRTDPSGLVSVSQDPQPKKEDCYHPSSNLTCPAERIVKKLCDKASQLPGGGWADKAWGELTSALCNTWNPYTGGSADGKTTIHCDCDGCEDRGGMVALTQQDANNPDRFHVSVYFELLELENERGHSYHNCCPCADDLELTMMHEFLHVACGRYAVENGLDPKTYCEHPNNFAGSHGWDVLAEWVLACMEYPNELLCGLGGTQ